MKRRRWTDEQLATAVASCSNFTDVLRALGLRAAGGNHRAIKRHAARLALRVDHFSSERRTRGLRARHAAVRVTAEQAFQVGSAVSRSALRKLALANLRPVRCAICDNAGEWLGRPLTLELDHVNGVADDHRLENLRWLCPNCHSQTERYAGRGMPRA